MPTSLAAAQSALATARDDLAVARVVARLRQQGVRPNMIWPVVARHARILGSRTLPGILARREACRALADNQALDASAREACLLHVVTLFEHAPQYGRCLRSPLRRAIAALECTLAAGWLDPDGAACARLFESACAPTTADEPGARQVLARLPNASEEALSARYDEHAPVARSLLLEAPTLTTPDLVRLIPAIDARDVARLARHPQATPVVWDALLDEHERLERQLRSEGRAVWGAAFLNALASHPTASQLERVRQFVLNRARGLAIDEEIFLVGLCLTPDTINGVLDAMLARPGVDPAYAVTHLLALASDDTLRAVDRRVLAPWFAADVDEDARRFMCEILPALGPRGVTLAERPCPTWGDILPF